MRQPGAARQHQAKNVRLQRGHLEEEPGAAHLPGVRVHCQGPRLHGDLERPPPQDLWRRGGPVHAAAPHDQGARRPQRLAQEGRAQGVLRRLAFVDGAGHERGHEQVRGVPVRGRLVVPEPQLLPVLHAQQHGLRQPVPVDVLGHGDGQPLALLLRDAVLLAQDVVQALADAVGEGGMVVHAVHGGVEAQRGHLRLVHQDDARGLRPGAAGLVGVAEHGLGRDLRAAQGARDGVVDRGLRVVLGRRDDLGQVQLDRGAEQHRVQLRELLVVLARDLLAVLPRGPRLRLRPGPKVLRVLQGWELRQRHSEHLQVVVQVPEVVLAALPRLPQEVRDEDGVQDD
mmetsp:Transcript_93541/g.273926  ORF Transcript_93541/g.273926 Transcript_93541/m.273926 type:complete len:341 (+) Transcript_93541:127-1149(+)